MIDRELDIRSAISQLWPAANITTLEALPGDASTRRYVRVHVANAPFPSVMAMLLDQGRAPIVGGNSQRNPNDTFVEVGNFLRARKLPCPQLLLDNRVERLLIVEDVGSAALGDVATQPGMFEHAIDLIASMQKAAPDTHCIAFQRWMGADEYRTEALRFIEYYLKPRGFPPEQLPAIEQKITELCAELGSCRRVFIHRDFMPWNIQVRADQTLALIDFQDAALGVETYDLISLLHDRDIDLKLGESRVAELRSYAKRTLNIPADFDRLYDLGLLQRSLRLSSEGEARRLE